VWALIQSVPTSMMPGRVMRRSSDALPFILVDDAIMRKVVGVRGVAYCVGKLGCNTKMPIS